MTDLYVYSAMIENEAAASRIMKLVTDILETYLICDETIKLNRVRLNELRKLGGKA